jgi:hypothetical protein
LRSDSTSALRHRKDIVNTLPGHTIKIDKYMSQLRLDINDVPTKSRQCHCGLGPNGVQVVSSPSLNSILTSANSVLTRFKQCSMWVPTRSQQYLSKVLAGYQGNLSGLRMRKFSINYYFPSYQTSKKYKKYFSKNHFTSKQIEPKCVVV